MSDEARTWLRYAEENLQSARLLLQSALFNPALQNAQQAVEKFLKAVLMARDIPVQRTHSINALRQTLADDGMDIALTDEACDLLDAIYLPSKYPLGSALPNFAPDESMCLQCIEIAERVSRTVNHHLGQMWDDPQ